MRGLVNTMESLNEDGKNMAAIIQMIDGIGFQTNLLALNAAVEAARAGESGRGFSVVAEEVRNLAGRSAQAAHDIAEKVNATVTRAAEGVTADGAAKVFDRILEGVSSVERLLQDIVQASDEQDRGIAQVTKGLQEVDGITQKTAAEASNGAELADLLSTQVPELKARLEEFTAARARNGSNGHGSMPSTSLEQASDTPRLPA